MEAAKALISRTEQRRVCVSAALNSPDRDELGQFFTPSRAAALIAAMPRLPASGSLRVLDPGAGVGSLTTALIARVLTEAPGLSIEVVAVEISPAITPHLKETLGDCREVAASVGVEVTTTAISGDLITESTGFKRQLGPLASPFDLVIMNPPYRKLGSGSMERRALKADGVDCPNLYCAFLAIGTLSLKPEGQLVAITPRSFANGPYFAAFRRFFLARLALDRVHVFESRSTVFADSDVLQENIVFSATNSAQPGDVTLSVSRGHTDEASSRSAPYADVVKPDDPDQFIHIPTEHSDRHIADFFGRLPCRLPDLQLQVSTGKVVDFRARKYLHGQPSGDSVPLIYPTNLRDGRVQWPLPVRKAQALTDCHETAKLMLPAERYVLVKRFSSKEERRRVVAVICEAAELHTPRIGFENHLNVFHYKERGLDELLARGLCLWLNSSVVDKFFRTFSGHTQVNATDLRSMRYPSREHLIGLGEALGSGSWPDQEKTDSLVDLHILSQGDTL